MRAKYRVFRSMWRQWEELNEQAAEFATQIGRENVISISTGEDHDAPLPILGWFWGTRVVTVWYWGD